MPYLHVIGDIFTTELPAIGHGVNLQGKMGSGIARIIHQKFPSIYPPYVQACQDKTLAIGGVLPIETKEEPGLWIYNLASQNLTGKDARLDWLETSVLAGIQTARDLGHEGLALPRIGAGIGGLSWYGQVKPALERISAENDDIYLELWSTPDADLS